jgi:hypothetical protein
MSKNKAIFDLEYRAETGKKSDPKIKPKTVPFY